MVRTPSGLYVPAGKSYVKQELATISGGRDITRGMIDSYPLLPPMDPRLSGNSTADIYIDVLDHYQVAALLQQRRLAVIATEWEVIPGGDRRRDRQAADLISAILDALPWDRITHGMHYGIFFGRAISEIMWMRDGEHVVPEDIRVRDVRRFAWRPDGSLVLLTANNSTSGEVMPDRKFWFYHIAGYHDDDPYGIGLAHYCYWPVQISKGVIKLWMTRLDKSSSPTVMGHYPSTASPAERKKLLLALEAIRSHSAIVLPDGMDINMLEAQRGAEDYEAAAKFGDSMISKLISGHSAAADATPGRLGSEDVTKDVRADLVRADADMLCASTAEWVRWVIDWSMPGAAYPKIWRRTEEPEDLSARADRERKIFDMGYRPTIAQIKATYDGDWEIVPGAAGPSADATKVSGTDAGGETTDLAAGDVTDGQAIIDAAVAAQTTYQQVYDDMVAPILRDLEGGMAPADILGRLGDWFDQMDDAPLRSLIERGVAAADAIGRLEVAGEST